jgi:hypothetical protein
MGRPATVDVDGVYRDAADGGTVTVTSVSHRVPAAVRIGQAGGTPVTVGRGPDGSLVDSAVR